MGTNRLRLWQTMYLQNYASSPIRCLVFVISLPKINVGKGCELNSEMFACMICFFYLDSTLCNLLQAIKLFNDLQLNCE